MPILNKLITNEVKLNKIKNVLTSIRDSAIWIFLTSAIGLVQIIIYFIVGLLAKDIDFSFYEWIKNGTLITFSLALVSSIFFDAHFQKTHAKSKNPDLDLKLSFDGLVYKLFPWFVVIAVVLTTLLNTIPFHGRIDKEMLQMIQIWIVVLSYIYTFYYKFCSYYLGLSNHA